MSAPQRKRLEHVAKTLRCDGSYEDRCIPHLMTFIGAASEAAVRAFAEHLQEVRAREIASGAAAVES